MLTEKELSPLNSIKKEAGTGSYQGMRWRIEKDGDDQMKVTIYPEPEVVCLHAGGAEDVHTVSADEGRADTGGGLAVGAV